MKRVILCPCVLPVTLRSPHEKVEDGTGRGGQNLCDFFSVQRAWGHARKNSGSNGAGIFTVGYIGTTEDVNLLSGGVSAALRKKALIVPLGLLMRLHCKRL